MEEEESGAGWGEQGEGGERGERGQASAGDENKLGLMRDGGAFHPAWLMMDFQFSRVLPESTSLYSFICKPQSLKASVDRFKLDTIRELGHESGGGLSELEVSISSFVSLQRVSFSTMTIDSETLVTSPEVLLSDVALSDEFGIKNGKNYQYNTHETPNSAIFST